MIPVTKNMRILTALNVANQYGGKDAHHQTLAWIIDQMVRALTGCPIESNGKHWAQGESEEYKQWVKEYCAGEDGPDTYDWEIGIPP